MRRLGTLGLLLAMPCLLLGRQAEPPRLLLISIDGMMPAAYTRQSPAALPTLRRLAAEGTWARGVRGVVPTVTYPSHTTLITGVPPAVHGIVDNRIFDPEDQSNAAWYWYASAIRAPTLPGAARARGLRAAAVSWPVTVGMDLDANVPEFWRSEHPESLSLIKALSSPPHVLERLEASRGRPLRWPMSDVERAEIASYILRTSRPHVLLVHLFDHDLAEHEHGPGSPQAIDALEKIDSQIGMLIAALDAIGLRRFTTVAIVSDHGFRSTRTELRPNALFKQEGLLTTDASGRITAWDAYYHSAGGSGFVYLNRPDDTALKNRVWQLLDRVRRDPANGIEVLWTRADLDRLGAHPGAAFGIGLADGFSSSGSTEALLGPATKKGDHGYDPANPELNASLILAGAQIARRGDLGVVRMTQIAPTLARLLGVRLSPLADEPLWAEGRPVP